MAAPRASHPKAALFLPLLALASGLSSAEEPDFRAAARDMIGQARGGPRAAGRIGTWSSSETSQWLDASTFQGPFGLKVDRSCLRLEAKGYPEKPAVFVETVQALHRGVQECARTRVLPATVGLIYDRMPRTTVKCDVNACSDGAFACASHEDGEIRIKDTGYYRVPGTYFHELMHMTRAVDNQVVEHHNDAFHTSLRDEVYFWQGHCFKQGELIGKLRGVLWGEIEARRLSLASSADLARIYSLAFDACAKPLRYNERKGRVEFNAAEVEAVCKQYQDYLMMEINLKRLVTSTLTPLILECSPARDKIRCPRAELFDPASAPARALAQAGIIAPPRSTPYSPEAFSDWTSKACFKFDRRASADSPAFLLQECARVQGELLARPGTRERLLSGGVEEYDLLSLRNYFALVEGKARAVSEGPARYLQFAKEDSGEDYLLKRVPRVLERCADPAIKDSALCAELQPDAPPMRLMARLLMHWRPETLSR